MTLKSLPAALLATSILFLAATARAVPKDPQRFTVTVTGKGTDVILIPGLASSAKVWDATVKQLAATHRVHVLQIAGFAGSPAGPNGADGEMLGPLVTEISAYASTLKTPSIAGHSLGGLLALEVAATRPDAVGRVLVVDALPFYPLLFNPAATVASAKPQAAAMRDQMLSQTDDTREAAARTAALRMSKSRAGRTAVAGWSAASEPKVVAKAMYETMTTDARPALAKIKSKTTVLYAWDAAMGVPVERLDALYSTAYAGLDGVRLQRVDGSFHFIMLDQPEAFAKAVRISLCENDSSES